MSIHAAPRLRGRENDWGKVAGSMVGGGGGKPFLTDKKPDEQAQEGDQEAREEIKRQIPGTGKGRNHPLYQTAGKDYGQTSNGKSFEYKKPDKWHGRNGGFSAVQTSAGNYRDASLNMSKPKHPVLPNPSFGGNSFYG